MLPMMHVDDCLKATKDFLETPSEVLDQVPGKRTYNVAAMSFTPKSISEVIRQHYPDFQVKVNHLPVGKSLTSCVALSLKPSWSLFFAILSHWINSNEEITF